MPASSVNDNSARRKASQGTIFSPRDLWDFCRRYWYVLLLSVGVCLTATWLYLRTVTPTFEHSMVIMLKNDNPVSKSLESYDYRGYLSDGQNNELFILKSGLLMSEVVDRLHLDVSYEAEGVLHSTVLHTWTPIIVHFLDDFTKPITLSIVPLSMEEYEIQSAVVDDRELNLHGKFKFGQTIRTQFGKIEVTVNPESLPSHIDKDITVTRISRNAAIKKYASRIDPYEEDGTSLIRISCLGENTQQIDDILTTLVEVYSEAIIRDRTKSALSSAEFIDQRIESLGRELGETEDQLSAYKENTMVLTGSAGGEQGLASSQGNSNQLETNLYVANGIRDYLSNKTTALKLVPNVSGVGDANIQEQIANYNKLIQQRERLLAESGESNAVVKSLTKQLNDQRSIITGSMDNYISSQKLLLQRSKQEESKAISNLRAIPRQEQMAQGVIRKHSIKEQIYINLLNKREETAMQLAITDSDVKIIETPSGSNSPIAPKRSSYFIVAFLVGLLTPMVVKLCVSACNNRVRGRRDVEAYTSLSIIGQIPKVAKPAASAIIDFENEQNDFITESFRMMRSNLKFAYKDAKVMMITSSIASEGKSFVARNLAVVLALASKRVLLIDTDMRRHSQSNFVVGQNKANGLSLYLSGLNDDITAMIQKDAIAANIDFIPVGPTPPNPSELLIGNKLDQLIEQLSDDYDYIILDSVPALSISDAAETNRVADVTLYVINEAKIERQMLTEIEALHSSQKFKRMYVVLNNCQRLEKRYGYSKYYYRYSSK